MTTQRSVLDALEACYPVLRGTIRDHISSERSPFLRFFAGGVDLSHEPPDAPLPRGPYDSFPTAQAQGPHSRH
jgi:hypothetical protein